MKLWLTGYRNYEMNIFQPTDRRIKILRELIKRAITRKNLQRLRMVANWWRTRN